MAGEFMKKTSLKYQYIFLSCLCRYTKTLKDPITSLLAELQPEAIAFNGYGVSSNPVRWIGTEMGIAPDPNWSTGITNDGGDPDSAIFCPAECDTTLQSGDRWFWV